MAAFYNSWAVLIKLFESEIVFELGDSVSDRLSKAYNIWHVQSTLAISNSDISNSVKLEASI